MAPTTRLREKPSLRVDYRTNQKREPREHHVVIADEGSGPNPFVVPDRSKLKPSKRSSGPLARSARITKTKASVKMPTLKQMRQCDICADLRPSTLFPVGKGVKVCKHMEAVCMYCVEALVKGLVSDRKLGEARLKCLDPGCEHVLSFEHVKAIVNKHVFDTWDDALAQYRLRASDHYIACLNKRCGRHFSIEDCHEKSSGKKKIACPYCEYELCVDCNRPWHAGTKCDKNKIAENKKSEAAIKTLGAKPCPKCGVKIEKISGCDHMTCNQCGHHFCWQCFATHTPTMRHTGDCSHRNYIATNPANYFNGPINELENFVAGALQRTGPAPAPAPAPGRLVYQGYRGPRRAPQGPLPIDPILAFPDQLEVGFGPDVHNIGNVQGQNGALQQLGIRFQEALHIRSARGNIGPDHAAPPQTQEQVMEGNGTPAHQVSRPRRPVPDPVLQPADGNATLPQNHAHH